MTQKCSKCERDAQRSCDYCGLFCCSKHGTQVCKGDIKYWFHRTCCKDAEALWARVGEKTPWYDDPGKITQKILEGGLKGLNEVAHSRQEAGYDRHERLSEWTIMGWWYTDSVGNWSGLLWPKGRPDLEFPIVASYGVWGLFKFEHGITETIWASDSNLPPDGMVCDICKEPWALKDAHLAVTTRDYEEIPLERFVGRTLREVERVLGVEISATVFFQPELMLRNPAYLRRKKHHPVFKDVKMRGEGGWVYKANKDTYLVQPGDSGYFNIWKYRHPACQQSRLKKNEREYFAKIFAEAGYKQTVLAAIPNEYCGDPTCCGPWFLARTEVGNFKVGWRKRVINLEWTGRGIGPDHNLAHLFKGEDVTKDSSHIHTWGREKLIDYLQRIRAYLLPQPA